MRTYNVTLTGKTPLLMHHDNIDWTDFLDVWKKAPENKKFTKAGEDRAPAWGWTGYIYTDGKNIVVPANNIMRMIMDGGAMVPVPGGKSGKTFKAQTQSGMMSVDPYWDLTVDGAPIPIDRIDALKEIDVFSAHKTAVRDMGFDLLVKRAKIGMSKHVRVRPQFHAGWQLSGSLAVWDEQITLQVLENILEFAGQYKGLGDWRPGGKTPGPYGMFDAVVS